MNEVGGRYWPAFSRLACDSSKDNSQETARDAPQTARVPHDREGPRVHAPSAAGAHYSHRGAAISRVPTATNMTISRSPCDAEEMFRRIDRLGAMGTAVVTISGGEPLLHPELDAIIARIRNNGIMAGLDHQRLPAHRRPHRETQSRRPGVSADLASITRSPTMSRRRA